MSVPQNIEFPNEDPGTIHLPHDYGAMAGMMTLCGFVDIMTGQRKTDEPATCRACVAAMNHAHKVWLQRKRLVHPSRL